MKKIYSFLLLFLAVTTPLSAYADGKYVSFTVDKNNSTEFNGDIAGFNTAFTFTTGDDNNNNLVDLGLELQPQVLRFPGGTLANYYHPGGPGYGIKKSEVKGWGIIRKEYNKQKTQSQEALDEYISYSKKIGNKTLLVANVLYGTPEETLAVIQKIKDAGLTITGVELGNELYFGEYRRLVPSVENYINRVKPIALAIRKAYPDIKIGVISPKTFGEAGGNAGSSNFVNTWNKTLAQEDFFDAFIVHSYLDDSQCKIKSVNGFDTSFKCVANALNVFQNEYIKNLNDKVSSVYSNKDMWYTEWNKKSPETAGNTITDAIFITEMLMDMNRFNKENNNKLTFGAFHNYMSSGNGYGAITYDVYKNIYNKTAAYHTFSIFNSLKSAGVRNINSSINSNSTIDPNKLRAQFFYNPSNKKLMMLFVNKTGEDVQVTNIPGVNKKINTIKYIYGTTPYASFGGTGFSRKYPSKVILGQFKTEVYKDVIPGPYSIGVVEF